VIHGATLIAATEEFHELKYAEPFQPFIEVRPLPPRRGSEPIDLPLPAPRRA